MFFHYKVQEGFWYYESDNEPTEGTRSYAIKLMGVRVWTHLAAL